MDDSYKVELGKRIRAARLRAGRTQQEVATAIGRSKQTLSHWENGTWAPEMSSLVALAEALGQPVTAILGDDLGTPSEAAPTATQRRLSAMATVVPIAGPEIAAGIIGGEFDPVADVYVASIGSLTRRAVGITISDKAMSPTLLPGDMVIFEPSRSPTPGDLVLARTTEGDVVVRQWAPPRRLLAKGPLFPETEAEEVLGVAVELHTKILDR